MISTNQILINPLVEIKEDTQSEISKIIFNAPISKIEHFLDILLATDKSNILEILSIIGQPNNFKILLAKIANDEKKMSLVQKMSYRHKNGFDKLVLLNGNYFKLRLHFFCDIKHNSFPNENIHNHRWGFVSKVIYGQFTTKIWDLDYTHLNSNKYLLYTYFPESKENTNAFSLKEEGWQNLFCRQIINFIKNDIYVFPDNILHQIVNLNESTNFCTLCLTEKSKKESCNLFSKIPLAITHQNNRFSIDEIISKIYYLINTL